MKAMATLAALLIATPVLSKGERYLTYDEFIREVESGTIASVTVDRLSSIHGTIVHADSTNSFRSYGSTGSANDPLLVRFLREHGVEVSIREARERMPMFSIFSGLVMLAAPMATLCLLVVAIVKLNRILAHQRSAQPPPGPPGAG